MSRSTPRLRTVMTVVVALLVVVGMLAPAALAHAQLLRSDPAPGTSLPTTDRVVLTFNEDIDPSLVQVVLTGPDGPVPSAPTIVEGAVVTQPVTPTVSGPHSLAYRVVSADGHPVSGRIDFTLTDVEPATPEPATQPASPATTTAEPATTPEQPTVMSPGEPATSVPASTAEDGVGLSPVVIVGALAILAALAAGGAWLARARRHPEH